MSYARWSSSSVYVFSAVDPPDAARPIVCMDCHRSGHGDVWDDGPGMVAHMEWHREEGDRIGDDTIAALREDYPNPFYAR